MNEQATADLQKAVDRLTGSVGSAVTDIRTLAATIAAGQAADDSAAVEAAVAKLNGLADNLDAAVNPPPAAPTPDPAPADGTTSAADAAPAPVA